MRLILLAALLSSSLGERTPFAISCKGISSWTNTIFGPLSSKTTELPEQVFVFDEADQIANHALEPRQEFEPICSPEVDGNRNLSFSIGLILVDSSGGVSEGTISNCSFTVDRVSGRAIYKSRLDYDGGAFDELNWIMICVPTSIPVFDLKRNKF